MYKFDKSVKEDSKFTNKTDEIKRLEADFIDQELQGMNIDEEIKDLIKESYNSTLSELLSVEEAKELQKSQSIPNIEETDFIFDQNFEEYETEDLNTKREIPINPLEVDREGMDKAITANLEKQREELNEKSKVEEEEINQMKKVEDIYNDLFEKNGKVKEQNLADEKSEINENSIAKNEKPIKEKNAEVNNSVQVQSDPINVQGLNQKAQQDNNTYQIREDNINTSNATSQQTIYTNTKQKGVFHKAQQKYNQKLPQDYGYINNPYQNSVNIYNEEDISRVVKKEKENKVLAFVIALIMIILFGLCISNLVISKLKYDSYSPEVSIGMQEDFDEDYDEDYDNDIYDNKGKNIN